MKARDFVGGQHLQKEDIPSPILVTVSRFDETRFDGEDRRRLVLGFEELERTLVLNNTNIQVAIETFGTDDVESWVRKKIVLYTDPNVMFQGRRTGGLRLRAPTNAEVEAPL